MKFHNYKLHRPYQARHLFLVNKCTGKEVLHLGCSSGRYIQDRLLANNLLHALLRDVASSLYGIDIHSDSIEKMSEKGFANLYLGDAEDLDHLALEKVFDVVVAGDLLEHLSRPGSMLEGVKRFLKPGGRLIISTNNAFGIHYHLRRWTGTYAEHPEHVCFYSPETLVNLLQRHGYSVLKMYGGYTVPPRTWKQKLFFTLGYPAFRIFPILAGTLIVTAVPILTSAESSNRDL